MPRVKSIKYIGTQDVYNMEVETHHNFSVNGGLIVHNCGYGLVTHHIRKSKIPEPEKPKILADKERLAKKQVKNRRRLG